MGKDESGTKNLSLKEMVIKNFAPSWFAVIMGTGVVALSSFVYSQFLPWLKGIGIGIFYLNVVLFFVFLVPWLLRWILYREKALADLEHPILSNFYATFGFGMLVLTMNFLIIGKNFSWGIFWGKVFWFIGTFITLFFGWLIPYLMFKGEHIKLDHINPALFLPSVGLIAIPLGGSLLIPYLSGGIRDFVIVLNYLGWGSGFFLYLALLAISIYRFILHHPLPETLAPTIWINLGPIGVGAMALINLVVNSPFIENAKPFFVFAFIFWGFGVWWLVMAIIMTLHYIKKLKSLFHSHCNLSWWAFTFPLGAFVLLTHMIAHLFGDELKLINQLGFVFYCFLMGLWLLTLTKTVLHLLSGRLFREGRNEKS